MTIKTSSHRRSGLWTTYADTLKRNRGLLIFSLLLMLAAPVHVLLSAYNSETYPSFSFYVWSRLLLWIAIAVPAVLSAVVPFVVFHYLHSRRAIDLYHALPIKRSSLFFGKFLTGLTMVMLPTVVGLGSAYLLGAALFANDSITPIAWRVMLFSLCLYVFIVFVIVCCGTAWESILYATGLLIAVFCFGYSIPELMRPLYGYAGGAELEHWLLSIAPFYYLLADWSFFSIVPVLMAGVLLGLSFLLYRNRKSENTGSAFSYRFLFHIISLFISIAMVFFIYTWLQDLLPALLFGFLGYFILSVIANRGFKKLIPVIIRGAGVVVVMTVFILTFEATGGLGYETRIPALNGVKTVTLCGIEVGDYETYLTDYDNGYTMSDIEEKTYREKENIELVRELHAQILQERDGVSGNVIETPIILEYRLTNGLTVTRSYSSVSEKGFRKMVELNRSQEFTEQKYPSLAEDFHYDSESQAVIMAPFSAAGKIETYETLDVSAEEVAQALKKDILARPAGFEAAPTSDYIGRIAILSPREKPLLPELFFFAAYLLRNGAAVGASADRACICM